MEKFEIDPHSESFAYDAVKWMVKYLDENPGLHDNEPIAHDWLEKARDIVSRGETEESE